MIKYKSVEICQGTNVLIRGVIPPMFILKRHPENILFTRQSKWKPQRVVYTVKNSHPLYTLLHSAAVVMAVGRPLHSRMVFWEEWSSIDLLLEGGLTEIVLFLCSCVWCLEVDICWGFCSPDLQLLPSKVDYHIGDTSWLAVNVSSFWC